MVKLNMFSKANVLFELRKLLDLAIEAEASSGEIPTAQEALSAAISSVEAMPTPPQSST